MSPLPLFPRPIHLLLNPSVLYEVLLHPLYHPPQQHIALMYQRNGDIGYRLIAPLADFLSIYCRVEVRLAEGARLQILGRRVSIAPALLL